jgi:hypothetical protein
MRHLVLLSALGLLLLAGCRSLAPAPTVEEMVLPRVAWGAAEPMSGMQPHVPRYITIHHTATPQQPERPLAEKLLALQEFSQAETELADGRLKRAWPDIPYHYYVAPDGTIAEARSVRFAGDTNTAYDPSGHLLIVLEGNFEIEPVTPEQWASLQRLTVAAARRWGIGPDRIAGHRDYTPTLCPGEGLHRLLPQLRSRVARQAGSAL